MTTREEYAEAAEAERHYVNCLRSAADIAEPEVAETLGKSISQHLLAARVLRALAKGAVLCRPIDVQGEEVDQITAWYPIEEHP